MSQFMVVYDPYHYESPQGLFPVSYKCPPSPFILTLIPFSSATKVATVNVINVADWYHLHMYVFVAGTAPCLSYILMQFVAGC